MDTIRQRLFAEIQRQFNEAYPYLCIQWVKRAGVVVVSGSDTTGRQQAADLLIRVIGMSDDMTVADLEVALEQWFGYPIQVLRRAGNSWMETRMTRNWTLYQQNQIGYETGTFCQRQP
ncbi:hypothetical protein [Dinghuibacter silviterrae]|uniref:Uncharacterized protein n=1 Tax=Dinghuibacter silviterrae TaxID=1539049 RepID=A0A4R8DH22_9BACT|nr:hypothetical protein [Dinghuibacter silviterrae]TDW96708.1 hypothetical protein EDB95_4544 [Dinghuibacter silviterrae]